jgi:hypothetical protein
VASHAEVTGRLVKLESSESFIGTDDANIRGKVSPDFTFLTEALLAEKSLELQVIYQSIDPPKLLSSGKRLRAPVASSKCSLDIILYGSAELGDSICSFIDECNEYLDDKQKLYLQDPVGCNRNVPYCNPQRLPPMDPRAIQLTFDLTQKSHQMANLETVEPQPDLLGLLDSQEDLPEAVQPMAVATPLKR